MSAASPPPRSDGKRSRGAPSAVPSAPSIAEPKRCRVAPPPAAIAAEDAYEVYDTAPHLIPPGHPCVECGVFFSSRSKRDRHYDAVHLGLKPLECEHCAATFAEAGGLKTHISAVHLGLKPFECEHCAATFTQSGTLKKHLSAVHLGRKPFECEHCAATFTSAGSLKEHMARQHPHL